MQLAPFLLDEWLAAHEFATPPIRYNLASSTGPGWTLTQLIALGDGSVRRELEEMRLAYAPPEGAKALRERIAQFYDVDPDWVIVTTGASEALSVLYCLHAEPRASILLPSPAFPAMPVMARAWGLKVSNYVLHREEGFRQSADRVLAEVDGSTRLVLINTPHNPTGSVMAAADLERLAESLADRGIAMLVDEVYHPLYFGSSSASAARLPGAIVVSDFSKALSLAGLRIGWIIDRDARRRERLVNLRSYFTVSGSPVTEAIAAYALAHRKTILSRLQAVAGANLSMLVEFMSVHRDSLAWVTPAGGTVAFPWRLDGDNARAMCQVLAREGVLVAPGDCFDAPEHFRIGFGAEERGFREALEIASGRIGLGA